MEAREIQAKSILTPSKLPDADYVVNPYTGCSYGCAYCYASFMGRFVGKEIGDWGDYVFAKINAPELLRQDLTSLKNKGHGKSIFFSSVTDPYQGMEAKYLLTRRCLEVLADEGFAGLLSILTKSPMVLRDIDILKKIKHVEVGLTITTTDDAISRYFEKKAPPVSQRLETLTSLNENGISTYAFVGPLLPHYVADREKLEELFVHISRTGTEELYIEHINLSPYILTRLRAEMTDLPQDILEQFYFSKKSSYRAELDSVLVSLVEKYGFKLRLGSAIYHKEVVKGK